MDINATLKAAGLSPEDAAPSFEVTKPTVYNWIKGATPKIAYMHKRAAYICMLIDRAVELGWLPITPGLSKADRLAAISAVLKKTEIELRH